MNPIISCLVESSLVKFISQSEFSPDLKFTAKKKHFLLQMTKILFIKNICLSPPYPLIQITITSGLMTVRYVIMIPSPPLQNH